MNLKVLLFSLVEIAVTSEVLQTTFFPYVNPAGMEVAERWVAQNGHIKGFPRLCNLISLIQFT